MGEIQWLAELKPVAERVGGEVLGFPVEWSVENLVRRDARRPDVVVRDSRSHAILLTGEAKRPDAPEGAHSLVSSVVDDALGKAATVGAAYCFTTNFFETALFAVRLGATSQLDCLQGNPVPLIDPALAAAPSWWESMDRPDREHASTNGLRALFARYGTAAAGTPVPVSIDNVVLDFVQTLTERLVEAQYPVLLRERDHGTLPSSLASHALAVHLDLNEDLQCRFLIAQGIAEVLTAALFYHTIAADFSLTGMSTSAPQARHTFEEPVLSALSDAMRSTGDYESIFQLTPAARWVLKMARAEGVAFWQALLAFVSRIDSKSLTSDVLGSVFERLISPERRHQMGQHYTQPRLAQAMTQWAVRESRDIVLDPACGAGTFLVEAYRRLRGMGLSHQECLAQVFGNDLDPFAVHLASVNLATREVHEGANYPAVRQGDAFELRPDSQFLDIHPLSGGEVILHLPEANVVIGNPPYGRTLADETRAESALVALLRQFPRLSGANTAAWFLPLARGLLRPDAHRIALVMPVSVLQNEDLAEWRRWLRSSWNAVVWHTETDVWFSDARVATCVILLEAMPKGGRRATLHFVNVSGRVAGELSSCGGVPAPAAECTVRDLSSLSPEIDILIPGTKPEVLQSFESLPGTTDLGGLTRHGAICAAGLKLGHSFYKLVDLEPDRRSVRRTVRGLGMEFLVSRKYLRPLLDSPKSLSTGVASGGGTWLLALEKQSPRNASLRAYIATAKRIGVSDAPSVKNRGKHWWSLSPRYCRIAVPMNSQFQHQVGWFDEPGIANNNFNVVEFDDDSALSVEDQELVAASIASAFGALSRLCISGEVGCEGARRVLLSQFVQWPVLDPTRATDSAARAQALCLYREWRARGSQEMDELEPDSEALWIDLTAAVATLCGSPVPVDIAMEAVRGCILTVTRRRAREAAAIGGRTKGRRRGAGLSARVRDAVEQHPQYGKVIGLLTQGTQVIRLRPLHDLQQPKLWEDAEVAMEANDEEDLVRLLGPGFECAPPVAGQDGEDWVALLASLLALLADVEASLLGEAPAKREHAARRTWDELSTVVRSQIRRQLQKSVRQVLY